MRQALGNRRGICSSKLFTRIPDEAEVMKQNWLVAVALIIAVVIANAFSSDVALAQSESEDQKAAEIEKKLKDATAVCLVEITKLSERDARPVDGNYNVIAEFKVIKGTGKPPRVIYLVKQFGGLRPPNAPKPELPTVLKHDSLKKGEKHWFIFSENANTKEYPYGITGWWPEKSKKLPKAVVAFVNQKSGEDISGLLKKATAVCLVEVIDVAEKDGRPYDGNYEVTVSFRIIKSVGTAPTSMTMIKAYGGRRRGPPPALPSVLKPDMLKKGGRHWFIFGDDNEPDKYPESVVRWWPEAKVAPAVVKYVNGKAKPKK
jgi:hypothetical protein